MGTSLTADATPNRTLKSYYDDDLVAHQFGGKHRKERKAEYYEKYDAVDLIDAGYLVEDGIFEGDKRLTAGKRARSC